MVVGDVVLICVTSALTVGVDRMCKKKQARNVIQISSRVLGKYVQLLLIYFQTVIIYKIHNIYLNSWGLFICVEKQSMQIVWN